PAKAVGAPAPENCRKEEHQARQHDRQSDVASGQAKVLLQIRGKHAANRIADDERTGHQPARREGVEEQLAPKNTKQWCAELTVLETLLAPVLDPDLRLFDVLADVDNHQSRQHAD